MNNKYINFSFIIFIFLISLTAIFTFQTNNSALAEQNQNINIPNISVNDDYFCLKDYYHIETPKKVLTHAVSIIGWDDNAFFTDNNILKHTGTFIALNSWGTDSNILHISYDDPNVLNYLYTYNENIILDDSIDKNDITITNSNASFDNYAFPCAQINNYNKSQTKFIMQHLLQATHKIMK